jgi:hypothetical protein
MKNINTLLLLGAVAVGFASACQSRAADQAACCRARDGGSACASQTRAADLFLSPRAQANQIRTVSGAGTTSSLVSGYYLGAAAKNPARELRPAQFEIAPVVEKAKTAEPGCCGKSCCPAK